MRHNWPRSSHTVITICRSTCCSSHSKDKRNNFHSFRCQPQIGLLCEGRLHQQSSNSSRHARCCCGRGEDASTRRGLRCVVRVVRPAVTCCCNKDNETQQTIYLCLSEQIVSETCTEHISYPSSTLDQERLGRHPDDRACLILTF